MGLTATNKGSDFEITPAGVHPARCYRVVDLGTQTTEWQGEKKRAHKVMLTWELLGDDRMQDGRPFSISKRYTVSTHTKANMRKEFESWGGRQFSEAEIAGFRIANVLGAYCLINVTHSEKDGNTYANIASLMPLPKSMGKPEPVNEQVVFDLDDRDMKVFAAFSDKLKETIAKAEEWTPSKPAIENDEFKDDIPWNRAPAEEEIPF